MTTSGVDKIYSDNEIKLYHTNGVVNAESGSNEEITLSIYSADGSVVVSKTGTGNVEYPLTGLQKGVYIVRAVAGNSAGKTIRVAI